MLGTLTLALAALSAPAAPTTAVPDPSALIARWVRGTSANRPRVNVWVNREDPYQRGDRVRVYFKSDQDAHVTIVRIDTDGRMRILFPIDPWEDNWARGGKTFEVLGRDRDEAFRVDDYPGAGYIFAIASDDAFSYDDIIRGDHWDYHTISDGRVRGDPYVAVSDLAERIAGDDSYDYDVTQYDVEKHYDYPRFVCYDCHGYASWHSWNPYYSSCSKFRIVIYDDWYYYPYRRYNRGVYYGRPYRPGPRYVFKDYDGRDRNDYVTRVAQRPRTDSGDPRRPVERDRTSADVGGRGSIPVPGSPRRRTDGGSTTPADSPRRPEQGRGGNPESPAPAEPGRTPGRRNEPDRAPASNGSPERTPATPGRRNEPDRAPTSSGSPERAPERRGKPSTPEGTREVPDNSSEASPRRRGTSSDEGNDGRTSTPDRSGRPSPSSEPRSTSEPRREPSREPAREPSREPSHDAPRASSPPPQQPRAEPRSAPPQPRSTGEPQLKRRRP